MGALATSTPLRDALEGWDTHIHVFDAAAPVQAGHYQPAHQPLERIEAEAAKLGVGHLVLVQPSVYGTDNRLVLDALAREPGRHRAVVVVDTDVADSALQTMHALGVRGVRFNLVSPVGNGAQAMQALAPRLKALGWHVQWYAAPAQLAQIAQLHVQTGLPCVLDHLAGMHAALAQDDPAWQALARLADLGAWVKLSGWYRLQAAAPYAELHDAIGRVAGLMGERLVWGSDWPHTAFSTEAMPAYASVWEPVVNALGAPRAARRQGTSCGCRAVQLRRRVCSGIDVPAAPTCNQSGACRFQHPHHLAAVPLPRQLQWGVALPVRQRRAGGHAQILAWGTALQQRKDCAHGFR